MTALLIGIGCLSYVCGATLAAFAADAVNEAWETVTVVSIFISAAAGLVALGFAIARLS